jgi:DNA-binding beta-propeller fold protein YncE
MTFLNMLRVLGFGRPSRDRPRQRPILEVLEDRLCPSGGYLLVGDVKTDSVLRYDETTGAFIDAFVPHNSGNLTSPKGVLFGPADHDLYVVSGRFGSHPEQSRVLRYDGSTGASVDEFVGRDNGGLENPRGMIFGPDGNLYIASDPNHPTVGAVLRYDGTTGAFLDAFIPVGSGGIRHPQGLVFGPDGNLYVADGNFEQILRYDGTTGAPFPSPGNTGAVFVSSAADSGLAEGVGLVFGPDGNLYVACNGSNSVHRYDGWTGAFMDAFVGPGSGGLSAPIGLLFGPDGNLYVSSDTNANVLRYDGRTGAFLGTFIPPGSGGLREAGFMTFTETDPVTLDYDSRGRQAAGTPTGPGNQITDPGSTPLGVAPGHAIWLDTNVARGWFVGGAPREESEFDRPGNRGEGSRIDPPAILGHGHAGDRVMAETPSRGERVTPGGVNLGDSAVPPAPEVAIDDALLVGMSGQI